MRRRLTLLVAATTSIVIVAFLLPMASLIRTVARSDAVSDAVAQTQALLPLVSTGREGDIEPVVTQFRQTGSTITVFLPNESTVGDPARRDAAVERAARGGASIQATPSGGQLILQPVSGSGGTAVIRVLVPAERLRQGVHRAWAILGGLGLALFLLGLVVADRLARSLTRPITALAGTAERLERGDLEARVQPDGPPEVREVGMALNRLAGRIGELLTAEREAVADLSHRLRTPVTALRLDAESLRDGEERARVGGDVDELTRMVDDVIREARRPVREGVTPTCDAVEVASERTAFWRVLAEEQGRVVRLQLAPGPTPVRVSREDLAVALDALLGNVFAHTPDGSGFCVSVRPARDGSAAVVVEDEGPGFLPGRLQQRGESSAGSTGLGLDIARRTAEASGGRLTTGTGTSGGARIEMLLGAPQDVSPPSR